MNVNKLEIQPINRLIRRFSANKDEMGIPLDDISTSETIISSEDESSYQESNLRE